MGEILDARMAERSKQKSNEKLSLDELKKNIGKKVVKTSDKPFKSTFKTNTIKDVVMMTIKERQLPAYTFNEDISMVRVGYCKIVD